MLRLGYLDGITYLVELGADCANQVGNELRLVGGVVCVEHIVSGVGTKENEQRVPG